jgi:hypothetical protein
MQRLKPKPSPLILLNRTGFGIIFQLGERNTGGSRSGILFVAAT